MALNKHLGVNQHLGLLLLMAFIWGIFRTSLDIFYIVGHIHHVNLVIVNFSVMFTNLGHIHLVILIRSSE